MDARLDNFGVLQIEPTDRCNLSCRMCAPHHEGWTQIHGVPKGLMDLALYHRILDGLVEENCRFDHIIFQWLGDPSLHPGLEEMIGAAQRRLVDRVGYLRVDTNAIVMTPPRLDRLLELHGEIPFLVVFTLDAVSSATYSAVKGQDALERVRRHVRHFVMQRARRKLHNVHVQLQFVLQPGNAHEAGPFVKYWSDFLACHGGGVGHSELMIKRLSVAAGGEGQLDADRLYERTVAQAGIRAEDRGHVEIKVWEERPWTATAAPEGPRPACPGLWMTPVIRHDGHLMMCCADLPGGLDLGSLGLSSFRQLWQGPRADAVRLQHLAGRFEGPCAGCGGIHWYKLPLPVAREWAASVGRGEAGEAYARRMGAFRA